jgi:hypothetical protein
LGYIAETCKLGLETGADDITGFFGLSNSSFVGVIKGFKAAKKTALIAVKPPMSSII